MAGSQTDVTESRRSQDTLARAARHDDARARYSAVDRIVADIEEKSLYDHFRPERWANAGIQVVISCGDLKPTYLDFLASMFNVPCLYVRGNHDVTYEANPPGGWVNLDGKVHRIGGIGFYGLEGSPWYNGGPAQYTEAQMTWRARWTRLHHWTGGGIDVLVSHAAPRMCPNRSVDCPCVYPPDGSMARNVGQACAVDAGRRVHDLFQVFSIKRKNRGFKNYLEPFHDFSFFRLFRTIHVSFV